MKLKEILEKWNCCGDCNIGNIESICDSVKEPCRKGATSQIRKEVVKLVKASHGWMDFKKNLDKFCEEE